MKNTILFLTLAFIISGCNVKSSEQVKQEVDEIVRKSQTDAAQMTSQFYVGGQPGKITVRGIVVKKSAHSFQLDDRIKIEQTGGKGHRGTTQAEVLNANKAILSDDFELKTIASYAQLKTFMNLGCPSLTPAETEGLTEKPVPVATANEVLVMSAAKIFICGPQRPPQNYVSLATEELVLKNAAFAVTGTLGSLFIGANQLTLEGTNSISSTGNDGRINVLPASSVDLIVGHSIHGEGTLRLRSTGGNCVETAP